MKHILITGAGGAIGSALLHAFAARFPDAAYTLVDLAYEPMEKAAVGVKNAHLLRWDLSDIGSLTDLWTTASQKAGPVDALINCAGFMEIRSFHATEWALGEKLLNVDFIAPMRLMNLAVGEMEQRGSGSVVNFSSMAGRVPIRGCTYYGGAKAGLAHASEIATVELRPRGVHVTTVYPGPVFSNLESRARAQVKSGFIARVIPTGKADAIASQVVAAVIRKRPRVVYPFVYRVAFQFHAIAGWVTAKFSPDPLDSEQTEEQNHGAS